MLTNILCPEAEKIAGQIEKLDFDQQMIIVERVLQGMPEDEWTKDELMTWIAEREKAYDAIPEPLLTWEEIRDKLRNSL